MAGKELYYLDSHGKKQDKLLHEDMLNADDSHLLENSRNLARQVGLDETTIARLFGSKNPSLKL